MPRIVTLTLKIDGMVCSSCSTSIQGDLDDVENLIYGYCSLENHNAIIKYDLNITPDYNAQKFIGQIQIRAVLYLRWIHPNLSQSLPKATNLRYRSHQKIHESKNRGAGSPSFCYF